MRLTHLSPWRRQDRSQLSRAVNDPITALQRELNQLFEGFFEDSPFRFAERGGAALMSPKMDVSETDQAIHVQAEMPGLKEDDINVEFLGDSLRIRAEKKDERNETQHNYHCVERTFGMFERVIPVPADINRDQVEATYKNGVLSVTLPKSPQTPSAHKVAVKPGQ